MRRYALLAASLPVLGSSSVAAQSPSVAADTVRLGQLHDAAFRHDPRARQSALREASTSSRLRSLSTERLPQLSFDAEATYQTDVPSLPAELPGATPGFSPPKDRYQATVNLDQLVYDGGVLTERRSLERNRLAEEQQALRVTLYGLREQVNESFFTAQVLQERLAELAVLDDDLAARLAVVQSRVRAGTALSGEVAALEAERLRVRQRRHEVEASRRAALAVLAELTGRAISAKDVLILPAVQEEARRATRFPLRARPEFALFARRRERLAQQAALAALDTRPRISAFGQLGYGRPGLDFLSDEFQVFGQAGVRLRWMPWDWGTSRRDQEELRLEQQIVQTEEAAFTERLRREVKDDLYDIARLEATLRTDDTLVALREQIEREARSQLENGVVNAADYIERRNDVFEARIARQTHRAELARARVRYLTTLGVDTP